MNSFAIIFVCVSTMGALAGCTRDAATVANGRPSVQLTTQPSATPKAFSPTSPQAITMEQVDRYFAARSALSQAAKSDKSLADLEAIEAETEAQHATRVAANPKAAAILARARTSPKEFAHMARLLPSAYVAYSMLLSGPITRLPEGIDPALVDFMRVHGAEVAAKAKAAMD